MRVSLDGHRWICRSRLYRSNQFWLYLQIGIHESTSKVVLSGELASRTSPQVPLAGVTIGLMDCGRLLYRTMTDYLGRFELPPACGEALSLRVLAEAEQSERVTLMALGLR